MTIMELRRALYQVRKELRNATGARQVELIIAERQIMYSLLSAYRREKQAA